MCQQCEANREATDLLFMLIGRTHASCDEVGAMDMRIKLSPSEADRFCAWGSENEDTEDDDPAEHDDEPEQDDPAEESEHLESDSCLRFGADEGTSIAAPRPTGFGAGDKVISLRDHDGRPDKILGTVLSWRYDSPRLLHTIQPDDGSRPFEVDGDYVRTRSGHRRPRGRCVRE
jgi:hypothetical protein